MHRIRRTDRFLQLTDRRRGFTTPAVAVALLVVMMGLALIIDRIWLETAKLELMTAAESAALGAAGELASDEMLLANSAVDLRLNNAREVAAMIASQNYVCGTSVSLNIEEEGDVRFGSLKQEAEGVRFEESDTNPNTVVVTAQRTRSNNNPVARFMSGVSGMPFGDVAVRVEASINNDVVGLKPVGGSPIPALPIAIWESDPSGQRSDTWNQMIESRRGTDQYSFDPESHSVISGTGDGIPEMVIHSLRVGGDQTNVNVHMLDIGTGMNDTEVMRQFKTGLSVDDLKTFNGSLCVGQGATLDFNATPQFDTAQSTELQDMIGHRRVCFLYSVTTPQRQPPMTTATCTRIVACRVMAVTGHSDGSCDVTIQPTVMTSRNAMLASEMTTPTSDDLTGQLATNVSDSLTNGVATSISNNPSTVQANVVPNPYVYKLRLTQ